MKLFLPVLISMMAVACAAAPAQEEQNENPFLKVSVSQANAVPDEQGLVYHPPLPGKRKSTGTAANGISREIW